MPAINFPEYARGITNLLDTLFASGQARLVNIQVDQRSMLRGFFSGVLLFEDDSELHFREFVDFTQTQPRLTYAYHYQNANKVLIFRYDNAIHRPALAHKDHKHTSDGITLSPAPTLAQIVDGILGRPKTSTTS